MRRPARRLVVAAALLGLVAVAPAPARAERRITLVEAVELALAADPQSASARAASQRAGNAVLRAQLDRVSFTVDGTLRELWNKTNIGGATVFSCTIGTVTFVTDPSSCASMGGTSNEVSTSGWQGLSNIRAQVTVPLFSGFRVSSNVALKQRQEESALALVRQAQRDLALSVARSYWAIRRLEMQRDVLTGVLDRYRDMEAVAHARVKAGLAPPIDENRARLQRLSQEAQRADLDGQARTQRPQLGLLLGLADELVLADEPRVPEGALPNADELWQRAVKARPELRRAELAVAAQEQVVRIVRADYYPQLAAVGLFQYGNNSFNIGSGASNTSSADNPFANLTGAVSAGLQLNINLFNMLNTYTGEKDARFELARLQEEVRLARRTVEIDVRAVRARLSHLYGFRAPLLEQLQLARDNLTILEARYKNGESLVIEALQAQADLTAIERQLADLSAQIHLAWLELDAALGNIVGVSQ